MAFNTNNAKHQKYSFLENPKGSLCLKFFFLWGFMVPIQTVEKGREKLGLDWTGVASKPCTVPKLSLRVGGGRGF